MANVVNNSKHRLNQSPNKRNCDIYRIPFLKILESLDFRTVESFVLLFRFNSVRRKLVGLRWYEFGSLQGRAGA